MSESVLHSILSHQRSAIPYVHSIVGLKSGFVEAKEILTRFVDEAGTLRAVGELLEDATLAPESKVMLDLHCLNTVFTTLAETPITDHLIFVNVSPDTLDHPEFWKRIQPWLWDLTIPPHRIVLEITEACSGLDLEQMSRIAKRLRDLEFRIAVDDLGSGVASLAHMARLAPDFIKVDRSLVSGVHRRPYQAALLNALAVFAERMGVGYIAEGIETLDELQAVVDADVPWGQGFIFGKPRPLALATAFPRQ
ncbi:EAL domain-containing protein [Holophaga foetida]|uniref:EAL domain-containing protein n=1 Tax=Holophaga foetida TaxID=35839 RepID=UPI0002474D6B|nr:EAL domain-containing protein [Holophaga foetida]